MESFLTYAGIALALFVAFNAKNQAAGLEQIVRELRRELAALRAQIAASTTQGGRAAGSDPAAAIVPPAERPTVNTDPISVAAQSAPAAIAPAATATATIKPAASTPHFPPADTPKLATPRPAMPPVRQPGMLDSALVIKAKEWLFGGNLVAKIGLLILFIGISFLLKYATADIVVPMSIRLAGIVVADIALLLWGWRIRIKRPGISLPVQGAAMAILMLVTFGAFRMYELIPAGLAFGLLFVLTGFTCLLAVLQNALWLAIFGIAGGFAAPILTSTGQGSHIGLFSYYTLLNLGILGIAMRRSWRALNVLGFVFTFVIGTAWGVLKYVPENYLSAQLFLILFFLFYVAIAIIYASRQAPQLKNYVDATLVFGTPLVGFGLQFGLVKHMQFGSAFSALALGLFYMVLTLVLWRKRGTTLKLLAESFFALGIVFGTLAIPFALDGRWTSAAWALEGAGIVWVGLRQRQTLAWMFGLLVQAGAWLSFIVSVSGLDPTAATQSNLWLGFLLLAVTAFLMATNFRSHAGRATPEEGYAFGPFATVFLALASIWFVAGAWAEIWLRTSGAMQATLLVGSAMVAAIGLGFIAQRMQWQAARYFAVAVQIVAGVTLFYLALDQLDWPKYSNSTNLFDGPFLGSLMIGGAAFFSSWVFNRQSAGNTQSGLGKLSKALRLWSEFWWFSLILYTLAGWVTTHYLIYMQESSSHNYGIFACIYGIGLALSGPLFALLARRLHWPSLRGAVLPCWWALAIATIGIVAYLYAGDQMPSQEVWIAYLALWLAGAWLMRFWQSTAWPVKTWRLKTLHILRTAGPWLMIWPVGYYWISVWLSAGTQQENQLLTEAGWFTSGSWARYLPAWAMMLAIGCLMQRVYVNGWPVKPLAQWYQRRLIPMATAWSVILVIAWNLTQNGAMAPLPYFPLLNPLDLSTCFAILLGIATYQLLHVNLEPDSSGLGQPHRIYMTQLPFIAAVAAYGWFNLMLLRTASHYLDIPYQVDHVFASQFVQAMLSLVWSATALLLMRRAAARAAPKLWVIGAVLLGAVVAKLFFVDLSNVGGVARIISFVGVGLLMVVIGYVAPYPTPAVQPVNQKEQDAPAT